MTPPGPAAGTPAHVFAYGTLRPGEVRWSHLEPFVEGPGVLDRVAGRLFDTGRGYPAARFGGDALVTGWTLALRAESAPEALALLDEVEGAVHGLYHRVALVTCAGLHAWAYEGGAGLDVTPIAGGDWLSR